MVDDSGDETGNNTLKLPVLGELSLLETVPCHIDFTYVASSDGSLLKGSYGSSASFLFPPENQPMHFIKQGNNKG